MKAKIDHGRVNSLDMPVISETSLLGTVMAIAGPQGSAGVVFCPSDSNRGDADTFDRNGHYKLIGGEHTWQVDERRLSALMLAASGARP